MRLKELTFAFKSTNLLRLRTATITLGVSRYSLPSLWGRGCLFVVELFLFAKLITISSKPTFFGVHEQQVLQRYSQSTVPQKDSQKKSIMCARRKPPPHPCLRNNKTERRKKWILTMQQKRLQSHKSQITKS